MASLNVTGLPKRSFILGILVSLACVLQSSRANAQADGLINFLTNDELVNAAKNGDLPRVKVLLAKGADANAQNNGSTALMAAATSGHLEVVRALLDAKADVNAKTSDGTTALMFASEDGRLEMVRALLDAKANVNGSRDNGDTALFLAAWNEHKDVMQLLKSASALASTLANSQSDVTEASNTTTLLPSQNKIYICTSKINGTDLIIKIHTHGPLTAFDSKQMTQPKGITMQYGYRKFVDGVAYHSVLTTESAIYGLDPTTHLPSEWFFSFHHVGELTETLLTSRNSGSGFKEVTGLQGGLAKGGLGIITAFSGPKCVWTTFQFDQ